MMSKEERVKKFMNLMFEATKLTGITFAVEHGKNMILFDTVKNEPIELEITVGTEVKSENGRTQVTTFDKTDIQE